MSRTLSRGVGDHRQLDLFAVLGAAAISETPPGGSCRVGHSDGPSSAAAHLQVRTAPAVVSPGAAPSRNPSARSRTTPPAAGAVLPVWKSDRAIRTLTAKDMPAYPLEAVAAVTRTIKEAPTERVLLTYKEIYAFFGVSRATVARRLKDGKVPGIRFRQGRVLEDGPVRRLDRTQLLYLLLSVRSGRA